MQLSQICCFAPLELVRRSKSCCSGQYMWGRDASKSNRSRLLAQLIEDYEDLVRQLTWRLGSQDFAYEALHETFLRIDRVVDTPPIRSPKDFIFRVAVNVAKDRRKAQKYRVSPSEIDTLLEVRDESPDPAQIAESRSEIEALKRALLTLPPRQREIMHFISIEGLPPKDVAKRLGVSLRTVETDFKRALKYCAESLGRDLVQRLGGPRPKY
ncbi:MAG: RNA polymerase sigma factor [Methylovirgula sp.]|uniref:RNA polymerase sigma factor n=1 Tax=Methylovirgula sp. TaxID=1978224 RepID=UPI003075FB0F